MALRQWPVAGPSRRMLVALALGALLVHALLLLGVTAPLELRLSAPAPSTSVQVRVGGPVYGQVYGPVYRPGPGAVYGSVYGSVYSTPPVVVATASVWGPPTVMVPPGKLLSSGQADPFMQACIGMTIAIRHLRKQEIKAEEMQIPIRNKR